MESLDRLLSVLLVHFGAYRLSFSSSLGTVVSVPPYMGNFQQNGPVSRRGVNAEAGSLVLQACDE